MFTGALSSIPPSNLYSWESSEVRGDLTIPCAVFIIITQIVINCVDPFKSNKQQKLFENDREEIFSM